MYCQKEEVQVDSPVLTAETKHLFQYGRMKILSVWVLPGDYGWMHA